MKKIGIVGTDGRNKAWTQERIETAKQCINHILHDWITKLNYDKTKLVVVSGHCPVGKERWYNITEDRWATEIEEIGLKPYESPFLSEGTNEYWIKIYDEGGVDTFVEIIVEQLGIKTEIYPAEVKQWNDEPIYEDVPKMKPIDHKLIIGFKKGYHSCNIQIAEACDVLYCIVPHVEPRALVLNKDYYCFHCKVLGHPTNGGCYTAKVAKSLNKEVHIIII